MGGVTASVDPSATPVIGRRPDVRGASPQAS